MNNPTNPNIPSDPSYVPPSPLTRLGRSFLEGVKTAPRRVASRVKGFCKRTADKTRTFFDNFTDGDVTTKASYLVMGLGHLRRGQIGRGIVYLLAQILFILYTVPDSLYLLKSVTVFVTAFICSSS